MDRFILNFKLPGVTVNSVLEDTCVLVAAAFLIVRGPLERLLSNPIWSGIIFGLLGASEAIFPNARFPYASHTLACAFATAFIGWRAGLIAAFIAWTASAVMGPMHASLVMCVQLAITWLIISPFPKRFISRDIIAVPVVAVAQALSVAVALLFGPARESLTSFWTVPANTFGAVLLALVVRDAQLRSEVAKHRQEVIVARQIATEAQLAALRTRVQPHFLFNALTSIAALCDIAPERASKAAIKLGSLMRRALESDFGVLHTLAEELETVQSYVDIEKERFGSRLRVVFEVAGCEDILVPTFCVQILVENAILHGVSQATGPGRVCVTARISAQSVVIGVADNGVGLPPEGWISDRPHGLNILSAQIESQNKTIGRLRLARRAAGGTLAVMRVPLRYKGGR